MNIEIKHEDIAAAIQGTATKAIAERMASYEISSAIGKVVTAELAEGCMAEAVRLAVRDVDTASLTRALAVELQRSITAAMVSVLQSSAVEIVARIRGVESYASDRKAQMASIRHELFGRPVGEEPRGNEIPL